jgi:hypothetical protein
MTKQEELTYLFGILSEASKWSAAPDDNRDFVRLEVEERIRNLINGVVPEPDNLPAEEENLTGSDYQALKAAKLDEHLESVEQQQPNKWAKQMKWRSDKVRCTENGRLVWHLRSECQKVPRDTSRGGCAWTWKWMGPQDKKEQCDTMWAEHEAGNAE